MSKTNWLSRLHLPKWLLAILILIFILRIPSFFEPYYYGDEMIYLTLGQGVRQGLTLYKDIHDNKPPLLYLTAALAENLFMFKVILCFWNLLTIVLFYKLSTNLFPKNINLQKVSTFIFAILTTIPLFEGTIANAELFMIIFTIAAFLLLLQKTLSFKNVYFAGVLFGLGALFKIPAAFDMPAVIIYWFIVNDYKNWSEVIKNSVILVIGFATPIILSFGWYFLRGALSEYIKAAFLQNVGYLSSFRPSDVQKPFYIRNSPLLTRAFVVLFGSVILFLLKNRLSKKFILLSLWTLLGLFAVTLSERPYPHYFIQVIPPISFLLGILFTENSLEQSFTVIPLTLAFLVPYYYHFYSYAVIPYYTNFVKFVTRSEDKNAYFLYFSPNVERNYQIANFLTKSSFKNDRTFIWDSDSATIYALARRLPPIKYVADYHVNDFSTKSEVADHLAANPPKFIIITTNHPFDDLGELIKKRYLLISQIQNANVYVKSNLGN